MLYKPMMSKKEIEKRRIWQEETYQTLKKQNKKQKVKLLGKELIVLPGVFAPLWGDSPLLAKAVKKFVKKGDRVLDVGTGTGVQAIFAADKASEVVAIDINPVAVKCAKLNIKKHKLDKKIKVKKSDLFSNVVGKFDVIIFNPPFRWFKPRDMLERGELDEDYKTLRKFFRQARKYLSPNGKILLTFSTTGDIKYLEKLMQDRKFKYSIIAKKKVKKSWRTYIVYRIIPS